PPHLPILLLTLTAFLLRAWRLDYQSYWLDEAWTVYFAGLSPREMFRYLLTTEAHPPFYHPSTIFWRQLVGASEYGMRYYSLLFGVLAVPLTYRLGRDLLTPRAGLIAAVLVAFAPYQVWHSQEARMYSLLTATAALSMWSFVNLLRKGGWRWQALYILGTVWALASHYHAVMVIGVQGLYLLLTLPRSRRYLLRWGVALLGVILLYAPWLAVSWDLLKNRANWVPQTTLGEAYLRSAVAYSLNEFVPRQQAVWLILPFLALFGLGLWAAARRRHPLPALPLLAAFSLAPILVAWLYGELRPNSVAFLERYLIPSQLGYLLTIALGIDALARGRPGQQTGRPSRRGLAAGALLLLLVLDGWTLYHHYTDPGYAKPDWRGVARTITNFQLPGDGVIVTGDGGEKLFPLYFRGPAPVYTPFNTPVPPPDEARRILADIAARHRRLWYTPYGAPIDPILQDWLARNAYPAWHRWIGRKQLALYATQADLSRREALHHPFADPPGPGLTLLQAGLPAGPVPAGDLLPLALTWQADAPLPADYRLSLRLVNPRGDIFAQSDWPPLTAVLPTTAWPAGQPVTDRRSLWIPVDTPPGEYALQVLVYHPADGHPLGSPAVIQPVAVAPATIAPPPASLDIPNFSPAPVLSARGVGLVGFAVPPRLQPGQELWLWLYWQATGPVEPLTIRLTLDDGQTALPVDLPLPEITGPTDGWQAGQVRRGVVHLPTSPRLTGQQANLNIALLNAAGQVVEQTTLTRPNLDVRARRFEPPAIARPLQASLGQPPLVRLLGYDLPETTVAPGDPLTVTLYWQAAAEMDTSYTVFVQLLNAAGQVVAQIDTPPQNGAAPTTTWLSGEILTDPYTLTLPPDLPPGDYRLITGMYHPATGQRLPVDSGGDFVFLSQVTVQ
ncbi:MAG: hypothetical protein D6784_08250, partial [Chloroflexi bacterium]